MVNVIPEPSNEALESFHVYGVAQLTRCIVRTIFKAKELGIEIEPGFMDVWVNRGGYMVRGSILFEKESDEEE